MSLQKMIFALQLLQDVLCAHVQHDHHKALLKASQSITKQLLKQLNKARKQAMHQKKATSMELTRLIICLPQLLHENFTTAHLLSPRVFTFIGTSFPVQCGGNILRFYLFVQLVVVAVLFGIKICCLPDQLD